MVISDIIVLDTVKGTNHNTSFSSACFLSCLLELSSSSQTTSDVNYLVLLLLSAFQADMLVAML